MSAETAAELDGLVKALRDVGDVKIRSLCDVPGERPHSSLGADVFLFVRNQTSSTLRANGGGTYRFDDVRGLTLCSDLADALSSLLQKGSGQ